MSERSKPFVPSYFTREEREKEAPVAEPSRVRTFKLDKLVAEDAPRRRMFLYDSDKARDLDQKNVRKAREGVKEIMRDALHKAKTQALEIRARAEQEGREEGYAQGFEKGEAEARQELAPFLETLQKSLQDLSTLRKKMFSQMEREMIELVVSLVKKIIHFELSTREDSVQEMIRLAVQSVLDKESLIIKINPADKGYAESFRPELQQMFGEIRNITLEAHSGVERGGCIIETNFGTIDARIDQLEEQIDRILHMAPPPMDEEPPSNTG